VKPDTQSTGSGKISNVGDLQVYRMLVELHLQVHQLSMTFPKFKLYELGSQVRRSSNSSPANLPEGFNNRHRSIYLETINRPIGEIRQTQHPLMVSRRKG
jgi:four helix bundle protein